MMSEIATTNHSRREDFSMSYSTDNPFSYDTGSVISRLRAENMGATIRELPTGGHVTSQPSFGGGTTRHDRYDVPENQIDSHFGLGPPAIW